MHGVISLVLLGISTNAFAGEVKDAKPWAMGSYMGSVGSIEGAENVVEIPLYRHQNGINDSVFVSAKTKAEDDAKPWMFNLSMSSHVIWVNKAFVKANKLKTKTTNKRLIPFPTDYKTGGELKYVTIPELHLGGLVLKNVNAFVKSSKGNFGSVKLMDRHSASLRIGLGAIPELSYAILNSSGKVRFVKAEKGNELLSAVGGKQLNYEIKGWREVKFGKQQKIAPARSVLVNVKLGDTESITALDIVDGSAAGWNLPLNDIQSQYGDMKMDWQKATIGDQTIQGWLPRIGDFSRGHLDFDGFLGDNFTSHFDIAVDQQQYKIGLKRVFNNQSQQGFKALIPHAQSMLSKASESAQNDQGQSSASNVKELKRLRFVAENAREWKVALKAAKTLTEVEAESCANWMKLGILQSNINDIEAAKTSFEKSSALYHHWWDRDIGERMDINTSQSKLENTKALKEAAKKDPLAKDAKWIFSQPEACYKVDGLLASIALSKGNHQEVEAIYRKHLDLDPGVAMAFGNSALVQGELQKANEAYRQALKLESKPESSHRLGLAMTFADKGEWRFAAPLFEEALSLNPEDSLALNIWLDNTRGEDAATNIKRIEDWLRNHPTSGAAHFAYAREAVKNQASNADEILKKVNDYFEISAAMAPNSHNIAAHIQYLVLINELGNAEALLAKNSNLMNLPHMILAKAEMQLKNNDQEGARKTLLESLNSGGLHPGYALFLRSL